MPAKRQPRSVVEQVDDEIKAEITDLASQIAAEEGPAPHAQYVSDEHEVEMWGQMDPQVDHETLVAQLTQGTVPPELVDPSVDRPLALIKQHPDLAQLFAEPLDAEMATLVATLAEYPFRLSLLAPYTDDPEASVKKSDSLTARWRRRLPPRTPVLAQSTPAWESLPPHPSGTAEAPSSVAPPVLGAPVAPETPIPPLGSPGPLSPPLSPPGASPQGRPPGEHTVLPTYGPIAPLRRHDGTGPAAPPPFHGGNIGRGAPDVPRERLGGY
jgi:hypothetical protein